MSERVFERASESSRSFRSWPPYSTMPAGSASPLMVRSVHERASLRASERIVTVFSLMAARPTRPGRAVAVRPSAHRPPPPPRLWQSRSSTVAAAATLLLGLLGRRRRGHHDQQDRSSTDPVTVSFQLPDPSIRVGKLSGRDISPALCNDLHRHRIDRTQPIDIGRGTITRPQAGCGTAGNVVLTGLQFSPNEPVFDLAISTDELGCHAADAPACDRRRLGARGRRRSATHWT